MLFLSHVLNVHAVVVTCFLVLGLYMLQCWPVGVHVVIVVFVVLSVVFLLLLLVAVRC